jgi:hypothetical protein
MAAVDARVLAILSSSVQAHSHVAALQPVRSTIQHAQLHDRVATPVYSIVLSAKGKRARLRYDGLRYC